MISPVIQGHSPSKIQSAPGPLAPWLTELMVDNYSKDLVTGVGGYILGATFDFSLFEIVTGQVYLNKGQVITS